MTACGTCQFWAQPQGYPRDPAKGACKIIPDTPPMPDTPGGDTIAEIAGCNTVKSHFMTRAEFGCVLWAGVPPPPEPKKPQWVHKSDGRDAIIGRTVVHTEKHYGGTICFRCADGAVIYYGQDDFADDPLSIEDISGDFDDLAGSVIVSVTEAREVVSDECERIAYTFATASLSVTVTWLDESRYGVAVDGWTPQTA